MGSETWAYQESKSFATSGLLQSAVELWRHQNSGGWVGGVNGCFSGRKDLWVPVLITELRSFDMLCIEKSGWFSHNVNESQCSMWEYNNTHGMSWILFVDQLKMTLVFLWKIRSKRRSSFWRSSFRPWKLQLNFWENWVLPLQQNYLRSLNSKGSKNGLGMLSSVKAEGSNMGWQKEVDEIGTQWHWMTISLAPLQQRFRFNWFCCLIIHGICQTLQNTPNMLETKVFLHVARSHLRETRRLEQWTLFAQLAWHDPVPWCFSAIE